MNEPRAVMLLYIAAGGATGALARYGLGGWVHGRAGDRFPWGTFGVNGAGSRRERGFAGATVLRGIAGFGASARLHTDRILRLSNADEGDD